MKAKSILFIDHDAIFSGSTISLIYLIKAFLSSGYKVMVATAKKGEIADKFKSLFKIDLVSFKSSYQLDLHFTNIYPFYTRRGMFFLMLTIVRFFKGLFWGINIIKQNNPSIIYINEYVLAQFAIAGKLTRRYTMTHIRSPFLKGKFGIRKYLLSRLLTSFNDYIFPITKSESEQIIGFNRYIEKIKIIPEFLDEQNFIKDIETHLLKKKYNIPLDKKIILMLGGLEPAKGSLEFIKSLKIILNSTQNVYYVVAGYNHYEFFNKFCYNYIKQNNLAEYIKILGYIQMVKELISLSDVLVSPFNESHFSRPIVEAWALKKPVITSDIKHAKDYIIDNEDGLYFKKGDASDLAKKILKLILDEEFCNRLAQNGYKKAKDMFYNSENIMRVVSLSDELLNKNET